MSDKDFRTLEQKIRGVVREGANAYRNDKAREKVTNVGRPETAPDNFDPRSRLAKQGEIKTKIIDEADIKLKGDKTEVDLDPKTDDKMDVESTDVRKKSANKVIKEEKPITPRWEDIKGPEKKGTAVQDYKFQRPPGTTPPAPSSPSLVSRAAKWIAKRAGGAVLGVVDPDEAGEKPEELPVAKTIKKVQDLQGQQRFRPAPSATAPVIPKPTDKITSNGRELANVPKPAAPAPKEAPSKDDDLKDLSGNVDIAGGGIKYPEPAEKKPMEITVTPKSAVQRSIERDNPGTPAPPEKKAAPAPKPAVPKAAEPKAPESAPEKVVPRGGSQGDFDKPDDRYAGAFDPLTQASPEKRKEMVKKSRQEAGLEEENQNMFSKEELERLAEIETALSENNVPVKPTLRSRLFRGGGAIGNLANLGLLGYTAYDAYSNYKKNDDIQPKIDTPEPETTQPEPEAEKKPASSNKKADLDMPVLDNMINKKTASSSSSSEPKAVKSTSAAPKSGSLDSMSFGDAFKTARERAAKSGDASTGQFSWRGKDYQTNVKGEKYVPMSKQRKVNEDVKFSEEEIERINAIYEAAVKIKPKVKTPKIDIEQPSAGNLPTPYNPKGKPPATTPKSKTPVEPEEPETTAGKGAVVPYEPTKTPSSPKSKYAPNTRFPGIVPPVDIKDYDNEPDDDTDVEPDDEVKSYTNDKNTSKYDEKPYTDIDDEDEPVTKLDNISKSAVVNIPDVKPQPLPKTKIDNIQPPPPVKPVPVPPPPPPSKSTKTKEPESKGSGTWYYQDPNSDIVRAWGNTKDGEAPWKPQGGANKEKFTSPGGQLNVGPDTPNRAMRGTTFGKDEGPSVKDTSWKSEVSANSEEKPKKKAVKESFSKETPMFKSDNKFGSSDSLIEAAKAVMEAKYKNEKELAAMGHPKDKITKKDVLIARGVIAKEDVASPSATKPPAERSQQTKPPANVPLPPRRPASLKQKGDDESDPAKTTGMRTFEEVEAVDEAKKASFKDVMAKSAEKTKEKYKDWKPPFPVQDKSKVLRYSSDLKKEEVEIDEAVKTGNEGYGYHGEAHADAKGDDKMAEAGKAYAKAHALVKKHAAEHLKDAKNPNQMVKHYLDSRYGRHLYGNENNASYVKKDFGHFAKKYNPKMHE